MKPNSLSRAERLRGDKRISRLFTGGKHGFVYPFRYYYIVTDATDDAVGNASMGASAAGITVLFSVPKKNFKRAVKRNLLKRRSREAYRQNKAAITEQVAGKGKQVDIALVYSIKEALDYKTIEDGIRKILAAVGKVL